MYGRVVNITDVRFVSDYFFFCFFLILVFAENFERIMYNTKRALNETIQGKEERFKHASLKMLRYGGFFNVSTRLKYIIIIVPGLFF